MALCPAVSFPPKSEPEVSDVFPEISNESKIVPNKSSHALFLLGIDTRFHLAAGSSQSPEINPRMKGPSGLKVLYPKSPLDQLQTKNGENKSPLEPNQMNFPKHYPKNPQIIRKTQIRPTKIAPKPKICPQKYVRTLGCLALKVASFFSATSRS